MARIVVMTISATNLHPRNINGISKVVQPRIKNIIEMDMEENVDGYRAQNVIPKIMSTALQICIERM